MRACSAEQLPELLVKAAYAGDAAAVARLLAAGADPHASVGVPNPAGLGSGQVLRTTPLCVAAGSGRLEAARVLLEGGADPSLAGGDGFTPLMLAAGRGHPEVLRLLLGCGAAVDAVHPRNGTAAFHAACINNYPDCAEALAQAGCDAGLKTIDGLTGRQSAEHHGNAAVMQRLRTLEVEQPLVGAVAWVHSLVGAPEHNGQRAAVRRHLPAKGRFELELLESGKRMDVKPANFELVTVPVGLAVVVRGLVGGAAEHNGKKGVVESRVGAGLGRIVALHHLLIHFTPESLT
jgi:hypothetical protein